ncbi:MAG: zinc ribbon domain-containing protein [Nitrososphaerota archaeon]|nr:zinc ribbon domain-containing protein [Nitrososphaerota archaeon]
MRGDVIALGVVTLIIGVGLYDYRTNLCPPLGAGGGCVFYGYPYQALGEGVILLAFVSFIVGVALKGKQKTDMEEWRKGEHERTVATIAAGGTDTPRCTTCGQELRPIDQFCPRCGSKR